MSATRSAKVRALAKLNLGLKVLHVRPDGYHEIRTVFQTISLADSLGVEFTSSPITAIELKCNAEIPENLVVRAAQLVMDEMRLTGRIRMVLDKKIPSGAGLGGGSSDAAAVLLALPPLAGKRLPMATLSRLAVHLGSDVPFFLYGGASLGLGRGEELYPIEEPPSEHALVLAPELSVSTAEAYKALRRGLTMEALSSNLNTFQSFTWSLRTGLAQAGAENDFEEVIFRRHPQLQKLKSSLLKAGAKLAMMTGSGSAIFAIFETGRDRENARRALLKERVFPVSFVNRASYRSLWWRQLRAHVDQKLWPPPSRYVP